MDVVVLLTIERRSWTPVALDFHSQNGSQQIPSALDKMRMPVPSLVGSRVDPRKTVEIELALKALVLGLLEKSRHDFVHESFDVVDLETGVSRHPADDARKVAFFGTLEHIVELGGKLKLLGKGRRCCWFGGSSSNSSSLLGLFAGGCYTGIGGASGRASRKGNLSANRMVFSFEQRQWWNDGAAHRASGSMVVHSVVGVVHSVMTVVHLVVVDSMGLVMML